MRWFRHVLTLEIRKLLSYRVDFWVQFVGSVAVELTLAWFLWKAIFEQLGVERLRGYTFHGMMYYYLLVPLIDRIVRGPEWSGIISQEIYEGGLTRYLVYPVPFFGYKYASQLAFSLICLAQLALVLVAVSLAFGVPEGVSIGPQGLLLGLLATSAGTFLFFWMSATLEMVAFWAENVWSLLVMLRFAISLLGGGLIPLALFPAWAQGWLHWLPFRLIISFPVRTMMGQVGLAEWAEGMALLFGWTAVAAFVASRVWRKGTLSYSGVGI